MGQGLRWQFTKGGEQSSAWSTSGMRATYRNGVPDSVVTYNVPITSTSSRIPVGFELWDRDTGLYVQDKWTPTRLSRVTQLGPTYGRVSGIQRGRLIKLGASIEF